MNTTMKQLKVADLKRAVAKFGGTVETTRGRFAHHNLDAPAGHVWSCDRLHCLVCDTYPGQPEWTHDAVKDAIERISEGVEPCTDPDCEYCHDE